MLNLSFFAERLQELMFDNQIDSSELARVIGADRTTVNRFINGKRIPSVDNLIGTANYFGCSVDYLLGLTERDDGFKNGVCPPFKERLKFLLDRCNLTKYKLQKLTDIPESAIYNWLRGDYSPNVYSLYRIAKCLDCTIDFVLGRGD